MSPALRRRLERLDTRTRGGPRLVAVADAAAAERARRAAAEGEHLLVVITGVPRDHDPCDGLPDREG